MLSLSIVALSQARMFAPGDLRPIAAPPPPPPVGLFSSSIVAESASAGGHPLTPRRDAAAKFLDPSLLLDGPLPVASASSSAPSSSSAAFPSVALSSPSAPPSAGAGAGAATGTANQHYLRTAHTTLATKTAGPAPPPSGVPSVDALMMASPPPRLPKTGGAGGRVVGAANANVAGHKVKHPMHMPQRQQHQSPHPLGGAAARRGSAAGGATDLSEQTRTVLPPEMEDEPKGVEEEASDDSKSDSSRSSSHSWAASPNVRRAMEDQMVSADTDRLFPPSMTGSLDLQGRLD